MSLEASRTRLAMLLIGLVQGLLLLAVHQLATVPAPNYPLLVPWYAMAIGVPVALLLSISEVRDRRLWGVAAALAVILGLTGYFVGVAVDTGEHAQSFPVIFPFVLTMLIAWHVFLPFAQVYLRSASWRPRYSDLFEFAWNNFLTLLIAELFVIIFWALLTLWAALFKLIGIAFFADLFASKYFVYPVHAVVFAFAVLLGRRHVAAVVTARRVILAVFKGLLPMLALIAVLFLAALPFMGLAPLWQTGHATALMLTLLFFTIVFMNAVYQDGQGPEPYPAWLRAVLRGVWVLLPIYALLCVYALWLRIDQYGWSMDRFWAALLTLIAGLYTIGYAVAALRRRGHWMRGMEPVNIAVAGVMIVLAILVNSPVLDARRITVASQIDRLLSGRISAEEFDYDYLRFDLGRPGIVALQALRDNDDHPEVATLRERAKLVLAKSHRWAEPTETPATTGQVADQFVFFPAGTVPDESFLKFAISDQRDWQLRRCFEIGQRCQVLGIDLNQDGVRDYAVFFTGRQAWDRMISVYTRAGQVWTRVGRLDIDAHGPKQMPEDLEAALARGQYEATDSPWRDLKLGGTRYQFRAE